LDNIAVSSNIILGLSGFDIPKFDGKSAEVVAKTLLATGFQLRVPTFLLWPESDWTGSFMVAVKPPSGMRQTLAYPSSEVEPMIESLNGENSRSKTSAV